MLTHGTRCVTHSRRTHRCPSGLNPVPLNPFVGAPAGSKPSVPALVLHCRLPNLGRRAVVPYLLLSGPRKPEARLVHNFLHEDEIVDKRTSPTRCRTFCCHEDKAASLSWSSLRAGKIFSSYSCFALCARLFV